MTRGQEGDRREDRDGHDDDRAEGHRPDRGGVDEEQAGQRDDHREPGERPRPRRRCAWRFAAPPPGLAPGADLLAVAGEDEERVVDRHADADHRGDVGGEHRHVHRLGEEVDRRAGDHHAREAERQRQGRGGERAEDGEQDQQHDREAGGLRRLEVLLGEVLHAGPQRLLADEVGLGAVLGGAVADAELLAEVDGEVGGLVLVAGHVERGDRDRRLGGAALRGGLGAVGQLRRSAAARRSRRRGRSAARTSAAEAPSRRATTTARDSRCAPSKSASASSTAADPSRGP